MCFLLFFDRPVKKYAILEKNNREERADETICGNRKTFSGVYDGSVSGRKFGDSRTGGIYH